MSEVYSYENDKCTYRIVTINGMFLQYDLSLIKIGLGYVHIDTSTSSESGLHPYK